MSTSTREEIRLGAITVRFLVEGDASGGSVSMFEFDVAAGGKVPVAHSHDGYEETIYGLVGTTSWIVDGAPLTVGPGDALCIPRGVVHSFDNTGEADATVLAVVTPGILGPGYFRELADLVAGAAGPPDPIAIGEIMGRHGLTPARP